MKKIFLFLFPVLLVACSQLEAPKEQPVSIQQWEVIGKDTFNRLDTKGRKQGMWFVYETERSHVKIKDTLYYKDGEIINPAK